MEHFSVSGSDNERGLPAFGGYDPMRYFKQALFKELGPEVLDRTIGHDLEFVVNNDDDDGENVDATIEGGFE